MCLPEQAVAIDGTAPGIGDEIQLTDVKAKVTRVENGEVYFVVTQANGQPITKENESEERPGEEPLSEDELRRMAQKRDEQDDASITA